MYLKPRKDVRIKKPLMKYKNVIVHWKVPFEAIRDISIIIKDSETVNSILMPIKPPPIATNLKREDKKKKNVSINSGTPALYLTLADKIEKRKKKLLDAVVEKNRKEKDKKDRLIRKERKPAAKADEGHLKSLLLLEARHKKRAAMLEEKWLFKK